MCDHLKPLHFQQSTVAFEALEWRLNYMPALPARLNFDNAILKWCLLLLPSTPLWSAVVNAHFIILQHVEDLLSVQTLPSLRFWFIQLPVFTTQLPSPHERGGWSGAFIAYWAFGACFRLTLLTHLTLSGWNHVGKWKVVACTYTGQVLTNHSILSSTDETRLADLTG